MTDLDVQIDDLQRALDNYLDAAISHAASRANDGWANAAYREDTKLDVITAIDALITARIRDLVKVG